MTYNDKYFIVLQQKWLGGGILTTSAYVKFGGGEGDEYGNGWVEGSVHGLLTQLQVQH